MFTRPGVDPLENGAPGLNSVTGAASELVYERRSSVITNPDGSIVFKMEGAEIPSTWSQLATDIIISKYFRKAGLHGDAKQGEKSARQVVYRIAHTIRDAGEKFTGYFATKADADAFEAELSFLMIHQVGAFNSPVWFNCGLWAQYGITGSGGNWAWDSAQRQSGNTPSHMVETKNAYERPQCSACFIQAANDDLMSIYELVKSEARLFKYGSGTGSNFSQIRGRQEKLSGGGTSSGLMSFLEVFDRAAGATKSGGTTRRAAKMVCLDMDHPEILDFINWKIKEEKKAHALIAGGYSSDFNGEAYKTIAGQNSNNSIRVTDDFMKAVLAGGKWQTIMRTTGEVCDTYEAKDMWNQVAAAAWGCADPGVQYDSTINKWHTCPNSGKINASNPCSEYMFLDDTACNLSSVNLIKFLREDGDGRQSFDVEAYRHACKIFFMAQEILVDLSSYPTADIARNSHDYRPLGLGYANLGALLMDFGLPYDSDAGRAFAACVTSILCGDAYAQSARIAADCPPLGAATTLTQQTDKKMSGIAGENAGACPGFYVNREPFLDVIRMHRAEVNNIDRALNNSAEPFVAPQLAELKAASQNAWDDALALGEQHGYRNSQVTVLAPTGTIGFMMDCDTTGVEPDLALVKYKKLVGGGMIKIVNNTVPGALFKLGYKEAEVEGIVNYIDATGTIEGAPAIKPEHLAVFDCSFKPAKGTRSISWTGHVKMMAAAQPFLSGAISKTVNLPNDCSVDDIAEAYTEAWRLGLKAVAIYRDGSKGTQPLNVSAQTSDEKKGTKILTAAESAGARPSSSSTTPSLSEVVILSEAKDLLFSEQAQNLSSVQQKLATLEAQLAAMLHSSTQNADSLDAKSPPRAMRHRLPNERASVTHKFSIGGHEGYLTIGLYPNGQPGEFFIRMAKEGSTIAGLMDSFATAISISLQHGVPLKLLCEKFAHTRFEPQGWTGNEQIGYAKSIMDYIFRWTQLRFLSGHQLDLFAGLHPSASVPDGTVILSASEGPASSSEAAQIPAPHTMLGDAFERNAHNDRTPP
ncbi:MAG: vitamin B12-dependent ribonucleotide reductase, partial [Caldimonas sp.]